MAQLGGFRKIMLCFDLRCGKGICMFVFDIVSCEVKLICIILSIVFDILVTPLEYMGGRVLETSFNRMKSIKIPPAITPF